MEAKKITKPQLVKSVSKAMREAGYGRGYRYEAWVGTKDQHDYACANVGTASEAEWCEMKREVTPGGVVVMWVYRNFNECSPIAGVVTLGLPTYAGECAQIIRNV